MAILGTRRKVDKSLQYRWGIVGLLLVAAFSAFYWKNNVGLTSTNDQLKAEWEAKYVKITCPRCYNQEPQKKNCSLCGSMGYIWVDKTRDDIPDEVKLP